MGKYLQVSFFTLFGTRRIIDLGPTYGEFIIYDDKIPKYHVDCFNDTPSNKLIDSLLSNKNETMYTIIKKINIKQRTKLSLGKGWPSVVINEKKETVNLNLMPLPIEWVKNIE